MLKVRTYDVDDVDIGYDVHENNIDIVSYVGLTT